jgi:uncharacterized membrane protein YccC
VATNASPSRAASHALLQGASTAFVAVFCYWTAKQVPFLKETYWAPIAAVVVMYPTRDATRKAAGQRFIGTIIGALVGWGSAAWWHGDLLRYGVALAVSVAVCQLLRLENESRLSAVAVSVITLVPRVEPAYVVAFTRFVEVTYGVACAVGFTLAATAIQRRIERSRE